jgi:riboflavin synthase
VGEVISRDGGKLKIATRYPASSIAVGASIACDGVCLTATAVGAHAYGAVFSADVSNETLSKTTLGTWQVGHAINLERPLKASDELGGHVVTGHVDGIVTILAIVQDGDSRRFSFEAPEHLAIYIAPKGSVALDGTSLTVNEVAGQQFGVNLIPHSLTKTAWARKKPGDKVNLEVDIFARYVARLMEFRP